MRRPQDPTKREFKARQQQIRRSIETALTEVSERMAVTFACIGTPDPDSGLDQEGLKDGDAIVLEYLQHNEPGLALEHLCYMIESADLVLSQTAYDAIASAGNTMQMPATLWTQFDPNRSADT